jgi:intein-encoded DNA endonuclease-like protein
MSENVIGAGNQQGSPLNSFIVYDPSETTRRAPFSRRIIQAYFQGALHDASLNKRSRYRFTQKGSEWLLCLQKLFQDIGYRSWIYKEGKDRDVYALETLAPFLNFAFDPIVLETDKERISYIRGFFDAEGGIPTKKDNKFYIQLVQKDKNKLEKIKNILSYVGIKTGIIHNPSKRVDPYYWRMFVSTSSHQKFAKIIGSWHPRKIEIFRERVKI